MNAQLDDDVRSANAGEIQGFRPTDVAVSGDGGIVTLRGNVGGFKQRGAAVEDAKAVTGVYGVVDELMVDLCDDVWDDEIRRVAIQPLI
jgi:osmotically-inducible protein OsmY